MRKGNLSIERWPPLATRSRYVRKLSSKLGPPGAPGRRLLHAHPQDNAEVISGQSLQGSLQATPHGAIRLLTDPR